MEETKSVYNAGACKFCGTFCMLDDCLSQDEANEAATLSCKCDDAMNYKHLLDCKERANFKIETLFGDAAKEQSLSPVGYQAVIEQIKAVAGLIAEKQIKSATIKIDGELTAKLSLNSNYQVKVERVDNTKTVLED